MINIFCGNVRAFVFFLGQRRKRRGVSSLPGSQKRDSPFLFLSAIASGERNPSDIFRSFEVFSRAERAAAEGLKRLSSAELALAATVVHRLVKGAVAKRADAERASRGTNLRGANTKRARRRANLRGANTERARRRAGMGARPGASNRAGRGNKLIFFLVGSFERREVGRTHRFYLLSAHSLSRDDKRCGIYRRRGKFSV